MIRLLFFFIWTNSIHFITDIFFLLKIIVVQHRNWLTLYSAIFCKSNYIPTSYSNSRLLSSNECSILFSNGIMNSKWSILWCDWEERSTKLPWQTEEIIWNVEIIVHYMKEHWRNIPTNGHRLRRYSEKKNIDKNLSLTKSTRLSLKVPIQCKHPSMYQILYNFICFIGAHSIAMIAHTHSWMIDQHEWYKIYNSLELHGITVLVQVIHKVSRLKTKWRTHFDLIVFVESLHIFALIRPNYKRFEFLEPEFF